MPAAHFMNYVILTFDRLTSGSMHVEVQVWCR